MIVLSGLLVAICLSCKKNAGSTISLNGVYNESSPFSGRSQLNFTSNNLVIKSESGSIYKDTFYYSISSDEITLRHHSTVDNTVSSLYFHRYNSDSFKIANMYASIPENPPTYMVFKK